MRLPPLACSLVLSFLLSSPAVANPRKLPFTYHYATTAKGALELEQFVDFVPVRVSKENDADTQAVTSARFNLETEFEYGLTDHIELGLYYVFRQAAGSSVQPLQFSGLKQRARIRFAEEGDLPIDLGLYLEVGEFGNEFEFEQKLLLHKRLGALRLMSNLWVEQEYYFQEGEWLNMYNPTFGAAVELSPNVSLGVEYWARGEFSEPFGASRHYAGPTAMVASEAVWLSAAAYYRVDERASVDDPNGNFWVRTILGVDL